MPEGLHLHHTGDNLIDRLRSDWIATARTVPLANAREQDPQVVVDLRDRAYRTSRIIAAGFLRNRNRRAQSGDQIDIRLGHLPKELPSETGKGLDVATLPFGKDGIERQRAFAASRNAGQAYQLVARQNQVDVAQVMFAGAANDDVGNRHLWQDEE